MYEELLTQAEIQGNINKVNGRYHIIVIVLIERVLQNLCSSFSIMLTKFKGSSPVFVGCFSGGVLVFFSCVVLLLLVGFGFGF